MQVREVMTKNPVTLDASARVVEAAQAMREHNIGDVVVRRDGKLCGILTDRDIALRVVGEGLDPRITNVDSICSHGLTTVSPNDDTKDAVRLMKQNAVRRLPVVEDSKIMGIVSLGDLAQALDRQSALGEISAAPPNNDSPSSKERYDGWV
jgi:CBS domain-containing protein